MVINLRIFFNFYCNLVRNIYMLIFFQNFYWGHESHDPCASPLSSTSDNNKKNHLNVPVMKNHIMVQIKMK